MSGPERPQPRAARDLAAFLFYCFIFGQSLLFLERGPHKRAKLIAKSAEKLLDEEAWARPKEFSSGRAHLTKKSAQPFSFLLHAL